MYARTRSLAVSPSRLVILALCALGPLGCSGDRSAACRAGEDCPGDDGGGAITCGIRDTSFPTFDKTCATVGDCAIGVHQTDCCGSTTAIGLARSEQARFDAAEAVCVEQYPLCACAQRSSAEDGQSVTSGTRIVLTCHASRCMTVIQ
jgi:hypothetical protein